MIGQHPELAQLTDRRHLVDFFIEHESAGRHHSQFDLVCHFLSVAKVLSKIERLDRFKRFERNVAFCSSRSNPTISSSRQSRLNNKSRRHLLGFFDRLLDGANHVKSLFGDIIVFSLDDFLKRANRVLKFDICPRDPGKLFGNVERL